MDLKRKLMLTLPKSGVLPHPPRHKSRGAIGAAPEEASPSANTRKHLLSSGSVFYNKLSYSEQFSTRNFAFKLFLRIEQGVSTICENVFGTRVSIVLSYFATRTI